MADTQARYDAINHLWSTIVLPPISRVEAMRAARRLFKKFGSVALGGPLMCRPARFGGTVRRCWINRKPHAPLSKGWPRLVHDVSHQIFAQRHPNFRPHAGGHASLELEMAEYVIAREWLSGALRSQKKRKPSLMERRAQAIKRTEQAIARWESKQRRAERALKKLRRRYRGQVRRNEQSSDVIDARTAS